LPPGHPPAAASSGALPPGHPPAAASSGALPPGHPPAAASSGALPPGHPPADGRRRPSARGHGMGSLFQPPEDELVPEEGWTPGTIEVHVLDADDAPVVGAPVVLSAVHASVATGEQRERLSSATDANGVARFEGMKTGMATSYAASSVRAPSRFESETFNLPEKGGMRVVLHVYDTVTDVADAQVGIRALAFFSLREDAIQAEQMLEVFNLGRTAWQAEVPVQLPDDFKGFNRAEEGGVANVDPTAEGYVLRGTFRPGRTAIGFRWQVPLDNDPAQSFPIGLPPRVAQARIIAEASKSMELEVGGAPPARRTRNRDGRAVLVTELTSPPGERGLSTLSVTLRGLPTKGPGRWIAIALGAVMIAGGVAVARRAPARRGLADDAREDLLQAREALLGELVALERARQRGDVGPKTYERVRSAMLDALSNVVGELEADGVAEPLAEGSS
jgi:hypothetical protein